MRASGKFTALQIKEAVVAGIRNGKYIAPARPGISYMLEPLMRIYSGVLGNPEVMTMSGPHYMFYALYLTNDDIGGQSEGPFVDNAGNSLLGERKGPFGYIIMPAGEMEKAKIIEANRELLKRLGEYKAYFRLN